MNRVTDISDKIDKLPEKKRTYDNQPMREAKRMFILPHGT